MTKMDLGYVKGEQGDAGTWDSMNITNGILWYNSTLRLVEIYYDNDSFAHTDGWASAGVTISSPYRPKGTVFCSCNNLNTLAYINTSGAVYGVHNKATQTGLHFYVMYHY